MEDFFDGIFGRNFLGGFFWDDFLGGFFWGGILWEEFFGRNSLFTLLKLFELRTFKYYLKGLNLNMEGIDLFVKILVFVKILSQWRRKGGQEI